MQKAAAAALIGTAGIKPWAWPGAHLFIVLGLVARTATALRLPRANTATNKPDSNFFIEQLLYWLTRQASILGQQNGSLTCMHEQIIHLHHAAPRKPEAGAPCNGCGVCCALETCPPARLRFLRARGPCPALEWSAKENRYHCGLLVRRPLPSVSAHPCRSLGTPPGRPLDCGQPGLRLQRRGRRLKRAQSSGCQWEKVAAWP
jgi:hypothetical protein